MKSIMMSTVSFSMEHINGTARIVVPVWFMVAYGMASLFWPVVAIWAILNKG